MALIHVVLLSILSFLFLEDLIRYFYSVSFIFQKSTRLRRAQSLQGTGVVVARVSYIYFFLIFFTLKTPAWDLFFTSYRLGFFFLVLSFWGLLLHRSFIRYTLLKVQGALISGFLLCFIGTMYILFFISELVSLLLILEIIAVLYYFFFLNYLDLKSLTLIKYKYFLGLYILMSYLVTLLFCMGLLTLSYFFGTLNYVELGLVGAGQGTWAYYFIFLAFFLKLGLPGLHFFKLELYQFISLNLLYIYSILTDL